MFLHIYNSGESAASSNKRISTINLLEISCVFVTQVICQYAKDGAITNFIVGNTGADFDTQGEDPFLVSMEMFQPINSL